MYDEISYKISWHKKFKKNLLILLIIGISLVIMYIYSVYKKSHINYFQDNMDTLKEVALVYYTQNNNSNQEQSLKYLVDEKKVVDFVDEDGNTCDHENSYIKKENNKIVVHLKCSNEEDEQVVNLTN